MGMEMLFCLSASSTLLDLLLFRFDQGHRVHSTEYASLYRTDIPGDGKFLGHMTHVVF